MRKGTPRRSDLAAELGLVGEEAAPTLSPPEVPVHLPLHLWARAGRTVPPKATPGGGCGESPPPGTLSSPEA